MFTFEVTPFFIGVVAMIALKKALIVLLVILNFYGAAVQGQPVHSERFEECLQVTLEFEGGLNDDPDDSGNQGFSVTYQGITSGTLSRARELGITNKTCPSMLEEREIKEIYFRMYWIVAHCHELPEPLDMLHFDAAVNSGPGNAARFLQRAINDMLPEALHITVDGGIGPETLEAIEYISQQETPALQILARLYLEERSNFFVRITVKRKENRKFLLGWLYHRILRLGEKAGLWEV